MDHSNKESKLINRNEGILLYGYYFVKQKKNLVGWLVGCYSKPYENEQ